MKNLILTLAAVCFSLVGMAAFISMMIDYFTEQIPNAAFMAKHWRAYVVLFGALILASGAVHLKGQKQ